MHYPRRVTGRITLRCTVRSCGLPLERDAAGASCVRNHRFDAARSGYVNLLQPQDRRSPTPGDHRSAIDARRRLFSSGTFEPLYAPLRAFATSGKRVLDSGCGEGSFLSSLRGDQRELVGADISAQAVDLAARSFTDMEWIVANLDRNIPLMDASLDLIYSIAARRNPDEFRRVLVRDGRVVVAVPAPDDLIELREVIGGRRDERSRRRTVEEEFGAGWQIREERRITHAEERDEQVVRDLLSASYRGQRRSAEAARERLSESVVTLSFDVFVLEPVE